ncbi:MAG: signal peptidase I [Patescibacteria group bacterium]
MNQENQEKKVYENFFPLTENEKEQIGTRRTNLWNGLFDLIISTAVTLIIAIFIRVFVLQPFTVDGQSMEPTFQTADYIFVDEITYRFRDPKRGEIVIFDPPDVNDFYIKRVIGLPNESIEITKDGEIKIYNEKNPNGFILKENYIDIKTSSYYPKRLLKEDEYFVMGDNRFIGGSRDSREFGPIHKDSIKGKAWVRLFPNFKFFLDNKS